jgi:hypothetical protein
MKMNDAAHEKIKRAALAADLWERQAWLSGNLHGADSERFGSYKKLEALPEWVRRAALECVQKDLERVRYTTNEYPVFVAERYGTVGDKETAGNIRRKNAREMWDKPARE